MNSIKILLGRKIRALRKAKNWTQEYLSELIGINSKSILRIECGQTFPTYQNLEKFCEVFDISISELFNNCHYSDAAILRENILKSITTLDDTKIRYVYDFLNAIK